MPVSPFDPREALAAAAAEHLKCDPQPQPITELTTLGELAVQRKMLGITSMTLFIDPDGPRRTVVIFNHEQGALTGDGETEAAAIEAAFSALRRAMLPPELRALLNAPAPAKP
jgi:hypothetical protein